MSKQGVGERRAWAALQSGLGMTQLVFLFYSHPSVPPPSLPPLKSAVVRTVKKPCTGGEVLFAHSPSRTVLS